MRKFVLSFLFLVLFATPAFAAGDLGKVLIIYYSYTGVTERVALQLAVKTDADVYQIETAEPYDNDTIRDQLKVQREQNIMPALQAPAPDITGYDLVIIGSPVWGGDVPPPVVTLLRQLDFDGRRLAYFSTSSTRPREYLENFKAHVNNAVIVDGINFGELSQNDAVLEAAVDAWLAKVADAQHDLILPVNP